MRNNSHDKKGIGTPGGMQTPSCSASGAGKRNQNWSKTGSRLESDSGGILGESSGRKYRGSGQEKKRDSLTNMRKVFEP